MSPPVARLAALASFAGPPDLLTRSAGRRSPLRRVPFRAKLGTKFA